MLSGPRRQEGSQLCTDVWDRGREEGGQRRPLGLVLSKEKGMLGVGGDPSRGRGQAAGERACPSRCGVTR